MARGSQLVRLFRKYSDTRRRNIESLSPPPPSSEVTIIFGGQNRSMIKAGMREPDRLREFADGTLDTRRLKVL
jgi:hypothetical protein